MKHEMISCNWILAKISISWVDTGPSVFFLLKEKDDTPVVSLGTEVARSCHYYIIPFCEALKKSARRRAQFWPASINCGRPAGRTTVSVNIFGEHVLCNSERHIHRCNHVWTCTLLFSNSIWKSKSNMLFLLWKILTEAVNLHLSAG